MQLRVLQNKDGTVTLCRGRQIVESFDPRGKTLLECYEALRWAAVMAGGSLSEEQLHVLTFDLERGE